MAPLWPNARSSLRGFSLRRKAAAFLHRPLQGTLDGQLRVIFLDSRSQTGLRTVILQN